MNNYSGEYMASVVLYRGTNKEDRDKLLSKKLSDRINT